MREELLLLRRKRIPCRETIRTRSELRVRRNHAQPSLPLEGLLANRIPALIELALVLVNPLLRHLMRLMRGSGGVVDEERLAACNSVMLM